MRSGWLLLVALTTSPVFAQDDWALTRPLSGSARAGSPRPGAGEAARAAHAATLLADRDRLPEALAQVARARALSDARAYLELEASLLERAGRLVDAERAYQQLLAGAQRSQDRCQARRRLAGLWRRAGSLDAHRADLRARVAADVDSTLARPQARFDAAPAGEAARLDAARMLVELLAREPEHANEQRALLARILEREPEDRDSQYMLEQAQREAGDLHAALASAGRLLAAADDDARAHVDEALELARAAAHDEQVPALLERVCALWPDRLRVHAEVGGIYLQRDQSQAARAAFQRAIAIDPDAHAVRLAWAELERAQGAREVAIAQLRAVLARARDARTVARAATQLGLLDRGQALDALRAQGAHPAHRRALLSLLRGAPDALPRAPLRAALQEGDAGERALALSLLEARGRGQERAAAAEFAPLLSSLSAQPELPLAERAAALRALATLGASGVGASYDRLDRALRPIALWALGFDAPRVQSRARDDAAEVRPRAHFDMPLLTRELAAREPALRALAALVLGVRRSGADALRVRLDDRDPRVRSAVRWALARVEPGAHDQALREGGTQLDLSALEPADPAVAEALFAQDPARRELAARLLLGQRGAQELPVPGWPFSLDAYLAQVARASAGPVVRAEPAAWGVITQAARAAPLGARALASQLVPYGAGVAPGALLEQGACPAPESVEAFSAALHQPLKLAGSAPALALLVHAGGASPALLETLRARDPTQLRGLLIELAARAQLPPRAAEALQQLRATSDWPTRMWATRALRAGDPAEAMALVRALPPRPPVTERCVAKPSTTN